MCMNKYLSGMREPPTEVILVGPVRQIPNPKGADFFQCGRLVIRHRLRAHFSANFLLNFLQIVLDSSTAIANFVLALCDTQGSHSFPRVDEKQESRAPQITKLLFLHCFIVFTFYILI